MRGLEERKKKPGTTVPGPSIVPLNSIRETGRPAPSSRRSLASPQSAFPAPASLPNPILSGHPLTRPRPGGHPRPQPCGHPILRESLETDFPGASAHGESVAPRFAPLPDQALSLADRLPRNSVPVRNSVAESPWLGYRRLEARRVGKFLQRAAGPWHGSRPGALPGFPASG